MRGPIIRSALEVLNPASGSRGIDAGCGIGSHTLLLARAVGQTGHVYGVDLSSELLDIAKRRAAASGLTKQVTFEAGDINHLRFDDHTFDWLWSVDCAGFIAAQPVRLVKELARVVRPQGTVAILVWSSQQLLPGHPLLEARLNTTSAGIAPFVPGMEPQSHPLCMLGWLRQAGLVEPKAETFVGTVHAPLTEEVRRALLSLLDMRWGNPQSELTREDWTEYRRLSDPDSPDFILDRDDYYGFFTYSMFHGRAPR